MIQKGCVCVCVCVCNVKRKKKGGKRTCHKILRIVLWIWVKGMQEFFVLFLQLFSF